MTMSPELFMAILSMDSYNRGYDEGIVGLGGVGSLVGVAEIISQSNVSIGSEDRTVGFYASAYTLTADVDTLSAGTIVISYRGTDNYSQLNGNDVLNGWITGAGATSGQIEFAGEFYNAVKAANPTANIVFTGHSLGGGLAGFMASTGAGVTAVGLA
jgi:hypothetical protein